jgi:hypothetical protein
VQPVNTQGTLITVLQPDLFYCPHRSETNLTQLVLGTECSPLMHSQGLLISM